MKGAVMRVATAVVLFALGATLCRAQGSLPSEGIGSYVKSPEQKAMEAYSRGLRAKRKADGEANEEKKRKNLLKAKDELSKSVGYFMHYDGCLALGEVYLALGQAEAAEDSCTHALQLKPGDPPATSCVQEARARRVSALNPQTSDKD